MKKKPSATAMAVRLIRVLIADPGARLCKMASNEFSLSYSQSDRPCLIEATVIADLQSRGLLEHDDEGCYRASPVARSWLIRLKTHNMAHKAQHSAFENVVPPGSAGGHTVLMNGNESPVAQLARRRDRAGRPFLQPSQFAAAERFRADFERGQLQPAITANWSSTLNSRRRSGSTSGQSDLTDAAIAARQRFEAAISDVGPEFSGVLIDACCLLKGLETIEHERLWPARSAKLVLQLALAALARHFGLSDTATGARRSNAIRNWGADGFRPKIS